MSKESATTILLENSAGQGTSIGTKLEELKSIYDLCPETFQSRLGYCIDTCHAFSAGYDLRTEEGYNEFMDEVERFLGTKQSYVLIAGWEKLKCIHLNDSKTALGGRSDRHDNIGHGKLTMYPFWRIMNDPRLVMVPKILETPVTSVSHEEEIRLLLNLIGSPTKKEEGRSS
jgi:apurinic endonuclease APN1